MDSAPVDRRYISEVVWLPTYLAISLLVLGIVDNSMVATLVLVVALICFRIALELLYRTVFGQTRVELKIGVVAFGLQVSTWALVWAWHAQWSGA
jgi:hypothetical protein